MFSSSSPWSLPLRELMRFPPSLPTQVRPCFCYCLFTFQRRFFSGGAGRAAGKAGAYGGGELGGLVGGAVGPPIIGPIVGNLIGERVGEGAARQTGLDRAANQVFKDNRCP